MGPMLDKPLKNKLKMKRYVGNIEKETLNSLQEAMDIEDGIQNGIFNLEGCRVVEPKLWEERYY